MMTAQAEYDALMEWASPIVPREHAWYGRPMPTSLLEDDAREWARANPDFSGDIPIRKPCQHCKKEFSTAVYGGLISPRFCSRECTDAAMPPTVYVPVVRKGRRKKHQAGDAGATKVEGSQGESAHRAVSS